MLKKLMFVSVLALLGCEQSKKTPAQVIDTIMVENVSVNLISPRGTVPADSDSPAFQKGKEKLSETSFNSLSLVGLYYFSSDPSVIERVCLIESVDSANRFFAELPLTERKMLFRQYIYDIQNDMMPQMLDTKILHDGEDYMVISKVDKRISPKPKISAKILLNGFSFDLECINNAETNHDIEWEKNQFINWAKDLIRVNERKTSKEIFTETK